MNLIELLASLVPLLLALAIAVFVIQRAGIFEQRAHRQRVEELLERIATAVEQNKK